MYTSLNIALFYMPKPQSAAGRNGRQNPTRDITSELKSKPSWKGKPNTISSHAVSIPVPPITALKKRSHWGPRFYSFSSNHKGGSHWGTGRARVFRRGSNSRRCVCVCVSGRALNRRLGMSQWSAQCFLLQPSLPALVLESCWVKSTEIQGLTGN